MILLFVKLYCSSTLNYLQLNYSYSARFLKGAALRFFKNARDVATRFFKNARDVAARFFKDARGCCYAFLQERIQRATKVGSLTRGRAQKVAAEVKKVKLNDFDAPETKN